MDSDISVSAEKSLNLKTNGLYFMTQMIHPILYFNILKYLFLYIYKKSDYYHLQILLL